MTTINFEKHDGLTPNVDKWLDYIVKWLEEADDPTLNPDFYSWADRNAIYIEDEDIDCYEQLMEDMGYVNVPKKKKTTKENTMTTLKNKYLTPNVVKWLEDDEANDPGFFSWAARNSINVKDEDFKCYEDLLNQRLMDLEDDLEDAGYFAVEDVKKKPFAKLPRGDWFDDMMGNGLDLDDEQIREIKKSIVTQLLVSGGYLLFVFGVYRPLMKHIMKRKPEFDAHVKRHPMIWGQFK